MGWEGLGGDPWLGLSFLRAFFTLCVSSKRRVKLPHGGRQPPHQHRPSGGPAPNSLAPPPLLPPPPGLVPPGLAAGPQHLAAQVPLPAPLLVSAKKAGELPAQAPRPPSGLGCMSLMRTPRKVRDTDLHSSCSDVTLRLMGSMCLDPI